jgi:hypothetical protein
VGLGLRQRVGHRASEDAAAVRPDHDAADVPRDDRSQRPDRVQVAVGGVGEVDARAAVDPAAVDEQRLVAVIERRPLDLVLVELQLGNAIGESGRGAGGGLRRDDSLPTV